MKRITALLHPNRIAEVVHALAAAGHRRFSVVHGQGLRHIGFEKRRQQVGMAFEHLPQHGQQALVRQKRLPVFTICSG